MNDLAVHELLADAVDSPPWDRIDLDAVVVRGRRQRRVRRVSRAGALAAAAVVVGVVAVQGLDLFGGGRVATAARPASIPAYVGPVSVPASDWPAQVARLLPGVVDHTYWEGYRAGDSAMVNSLDVTWRVRRDGHTALVRASVYFDGGGTGGSCSLGMKGCSALTPSAVVAGGQVMTYDLDAEYAHEPGRAVVLLRDVTGVKRVGGGDVTAGVEIILTSVGADVGPGPDGWTIGLGLAAQPVLTSEELVALVQELPRPVVPGNRDSLAGRPAPATG